MVDKNTVPVCSKNTPLKEVLCLYATVFQCHACNLIESIPYD